MAIMSYVQIQTGAAAYQCGRWSRRHVSSTPCSHRPSHLSSLSPGRSRSGGLDSLMRQLLSVDYLQPSVAHLLLLRLSSYMDTEPSSQFVTILQFFFIFTSLSPALSLSFCSSLNTRELCQMPALIINQLRWLDHIVNGKVYTSSCSWFESILCVGLVSRAAGGGGCCSS